MTGGRIMGATVAVLAGHGLLYAGLTGLMAVGPLAALGGGWRTMVAGVAALALAAALALLGAPAMKRAALERVAGHPTPWRDAMRGLRRGRVALVLMAGCLLTWGVVAPDHGLGALGRKAAGITDYWHPASAFLTAAAAVAATRLLHPGRGGELA
ncbi:MAG: hypothetical protein AAFR84_23125 [Pseudomonadota bacterium]